MPKVNLIPKFSPDSKITSSVLDIIMNVLENPIKIPNYLGTKLNQTLKQTSPYNNSKHVAEFKLNKKEDLKKFFNNYKENKRIWENTSFSEKKEVFLKAADLIENKYYNKMLAYTIVGQNKTIYEAEIDAICELVDFIRFNVAYTEDILSKQPLQTNLHSNMSEYNSLNGFVASITPFNFTAIAGNLASAPLYFGNSVLWKPSDNAILSNHLFYEIMLEAGLPKGVLNFCPMEPVEFLNSITEKKDLAGIMFTGSSKVFDNIYKKVGSNIKKMNNYPRLIGETGGKNFHFLDNNLDLDNAIERTLESAFNFSGQKCSAGSLMYVPKSKLNLVKEKIKDKFDIYMKQNENYGVINESSFKKLSLLINELKKDKNIDFIVKGKNSKENNYFIHPHIFICKNHKHRVYKEEFFGPILSIYPYEDKMVDETMDKCINSNNYCLTGSVFSNDSEFISKAIKNFKHKTGNFYVNDKSTGAVVGQQPFGGSGKSGTNDKAGDINMMYKLFNQRNIKFTH